MLLPLLPQYLSKNLVAILADPVVDCDSSSVLLEVCTVVVGRCLDHYQLLRRVCARVVLTIIVTAAPSSPITSPWAGSLPVATSESLICTICDNADNDYRHVLAT